MPRLRAFVLVLGIGAFFSGFMFAMDDARFGAALIVSGAILLAALVIAEAITPSKPGTWSPEAGDQPGEAAPPPRDA